MAAPGLYSPALKLAQVRQILDSAIQCGVGRISLCDAAGHVVVHAGEGAPTEPGACPDDSGEAEVAVPVAADGEIVGWLRADPAARTPGLENVLRLTAARLADAATAAAEIDSLAGEIIRSYEELNLLYELGYELGEINSSPLSVDSAAALILRKILQTIDAARAEMSLAGIPGPSYTVPGGQSTGDGSGPGAEEHRLTVAMLGNGETVGSITLVRDPHNPPFSSADGKLLEAVGTLLGSAVRNVQLHVAVRRQTEALRASEARLRGIMEHVADGILTVDSLGIVASFNRAAERLFGRSSEEILGKSFGALIAEPGYRKVLVSLHRDGRSGESNAMVGNGPEEMIGRRKDGTTFPMDLAIGEMIVDGRRMFVISVRDVTQRKRAEEAWARTERLRALGLVASGVAHNLNQSLAIIAGYSDVAARRLALASPDLGQLREDLATVARAAMDGGETLKRLLIFSRTQPGGAREPVNLGELAREVAKLTAPRWRDAAQGEGRIIDLEVSTCEDALLEGCVGSLREALVNLVLNAVDALPGGGLIRLCAERLTDQVVLVVSDNGIGMSPEVRGRIFEPFFTTKGTRGTGLGMATVLGVVERHGGTIDVDSTPGQGTTFRITFPLGQAAGGAPAKPAPEPAAGHLRVLAVDDEPEIRRLMVQMLSLDGHEVAAVASGEDALEHLLLEPYDLVVSDLGMGPGMNGWDLADRARQARPDVRFVLATGSGAQIDATEARTHGVEAVIAKPFRMSELRRAIAGTLMSV